MAVIKGKPVADRITADIKEKVNELKNNGVTPTLTIVRVGERGDDIAYERAAMKRMEMCGINVENVLLPADISQADFENKLEDDIYDYVSAAEYRVMDKELKKAYQYYEWNQRFGWFEYFKSILKAMADHLANFEIANNIYQENGEHRLIMFIH